jgi:hypothetical protein
MILVYKFINYCGFGDYLRGLISVLQIQKILKFELIIDFKDHKFEKYFLYETPNIHPERYIYLNYLNENNHHLEIINVLTEEFKKNNIIQIITNAYPNKNEIDESIKDFIKNLLLLRPKIQEYLNTKCINLPEKYNLFH